MRQTHPQFYYGHIIMMATHTIFHWVILVPGERGTYCKVFLRLTPRMASFSNLSGKGRAAHWIYFDALKVICESQQ